MDMELAYLLFHDSSVHSVMRETLGILIPAYELSYDTLIGDAVFVMVRRLRMFWMCRECRRLLMARKRGISSIVEVCSVTFVKASTINVICRITSS